MAVFDAPYRSLKQMKCQKYIIVALAGLAPLFLLPGFGDHSARSLQELWNLGHVAYFALFALGLNSCSRCVGLSSWQRFVACIVATVLVGGGIELCQLVVPGRTASFTDVLRDVSGSMIALLLAGFKGAQPYFVRVARISSALVVLSLILFSPVTVMLDDVHRVLEFPVLADFERASELGRWESSQVEIARVTTPVRSGGWSLRVELTTEKYSGLALVHFSRDWRGYDALCLSVYNPAEGLQLHIRIHDRQHALRQEYDNRFNRTVMLQKGWNDLRLDMYDILHGPKGRLMDLTQIMVLGLFVMDQRQNRVLYLDDVRLEKAAGDSGDR